MKKKSLIKTIKRSKSILPVKRVLFAILVILSVSIMISACDRGGTLSGSWTSESSRERYTFSGKSYTINRGFNNFWEEEEGTYSISGDKIKFVRTDGHVFIESLYHSEDTLKIGSHLYLKQR